MNTKWRLSQSFLYSAGHVNMFLLCNQSSSGLSINMYKSPISLLSTNNVDRFLHTALKFLGHSKFHALTSVQSSDGTILTAVNSLTKSKPVSWTLTRHINTESLYTETLKAKEWKIKIIHQNCHNCLYSKNNRRENKVAKRVWIFFYIIH